jgi:hypothetical protein
VGNARAIEAKQDCPSGEHWVRSHTQKSYIRNQKPVSGSSHKAGCQKNPISYAIWNKRLKSGLPPKWEFKTESPKTWTEDEKENVLNSLSEIPSELLSSSVEGIYRLKQFSQYRPNPAANHNHQIALYDSAFDHDQNLSEVLAHEFSHVAYSQYSDQERVDYAKNAEWFAVEESPGKFILTPGRTDFVEEDGRNGIEEDFSNNIEYFLFKPQELKNKSPAVFNWIYKKYGDKFKLRKVQ